MTVLLDPPTPVPFEEIPVTDDPDVRVAIARVEGAVSRLEGMVGATLSQHGSQLDAHARQLAEQSVTQVRQGERLAALETSQANAQAQDARGPNWAAIVSTVCTIASVLLALVVIFIRN